MKPYPKQKKEKTVKESTLWSNFSIMIRLRDTDENGYGKCISCGKIIYWKDGDCGHGVNRRHWGTRYNEKNNNLQCRADNRFAEGQQANYAINVNKKFGPDTWDLLQASKNGKKYTGVEMYWLNEQVKERIKELMKTKNFEL